MLTLGLLVGTMTPIGLRAQAVSVHCAPDSSVVELIDTFVVDIAVDEQAQAIHCFNFQISFDTSLVTLLSVEEGSLIDDSGQPSFFFTDSTDGTLNVGDCLLGYGLHVNGPGVLTSMTLESRGITGITSVLINVIDLSDTALAQFSVTTEDGAIIVGTPSCCGRYLAGYTGNTDCDTEGKRNLADITRLIDRVYISKTILCCDFNGNVDGDIDGKLNLADITRLIDHVYISKQETSACN